MSVAGFRTGSTASFSASEASVAARPSIPRRDTDQILSYYQSADAGRSYATDMEERGQHGGLLQRRASSSTGSTSSDYSERFSNTSTANTSASRDETVSGLPPQRRPSRTKDGSDKRRMAIVEMDHPQLMQENRSGGGGTDMSHRAAQPTLLTKRGMNSSHLNGLALVAPPDASPSAYTNLTPPSSAPPVSRRNPSESSFDSLERPSLGKHQRSYSEAVPMGSTASITRKSSRDVGIVGMKPPLSTQTAFQNNPKHGEGSPSTKSQHSEVQHGSHDLLPIFQTPSSRTPSISEQSAVLSSSATSANSNLTMCGNTAPPLLTPTLGRPKDVNDPVMGPIVVDLTASGHVWQGTPMQPNGTPHANPGTDGTTVATPVYSQSLAPGSSPYLYYQPGIHSTAGPLPAPPRQVLLSPSDSKPPPRPPRFRSPSPNVTALDKRVDKTSLRLPESVSEYLSKQSPITNSEGTSASTSPPQTLTSLNEEKLDGQALQSYLTRKNSQRASARLGHVREGAFPVSSVYVTPDASPQPPLLVPTCSEDEKVRMEDLMADVGIAMNEVGLMDPDDIPPPTVLEPPREPIRESQAIQDLKHGGSWLSLADALRSTSPDPEQGSRASGDSMTESGALHDQLNSALPAKINKSFLVGGKRTPSPQKQALDYALKRFSSLPRTPSIISVMPSSKRSKESSPPRQQPPWKHTIKSSWPHAMHFSEVFAKKSSLDRTLCYAHKINELAMHDCGLAEWVFATKQKFGAVSQPPVVSKASAAPFAPSTPSLASQPRHASHGSMASEITFPRRADAHVATDLSLRSSDDDGTPPDAPPPSLPYPLLPPGSRAPPSKAFGAFTAPSTARSSTISSLGSSKSISSGFFASIGRKASIKRDRSAPLSPTSPTKLLSRRTPLSPPAPRAVNISATPLVPGGPRAIPNRMQRSQSVIAHSYTPEGRLPTVGETAATALKPVSRRLSVKRRPSVPPTNPSGHILNFEEQVAKLADLLPHADRIILAGYLRRSGQDILAIGQYLEDERNGTLRRD